MVYGLNNKNNSVNLEKLTEDHLDAIREVITIGSGHSANALSALLKRKIEMKIPAVRIVPVEKVAYELLDEKNLSQTMAGLCIETEDSCLMDIIVLLDEQTIKFLFENLDIDNEHFDMYSMNEFEESILIELGNILMLQFITAMENFTEMKIRPKFTPLLSVDIAEAILNALIMRIGVENNSMLLMDNTIFLDRQKEVNIITLLLPSNEILSRLFEKLFEY